MLEAIYNIGLLVETGILTYGAGKIGLDYAWSKAVNFMCNNDLWNKPEVEAIMSAFMKEKL